MVAFAGAAEFAFEVPWPAATSAIMPGTVGAAGDIVSCMLGSLVVQDDTMKASEPARKAVRSSRAVSRRAGLKTSFPNFGACIPRAGYHSLCACPMWTAPSLKKSGMLPVEHAFDYPE
ncbi:MAG: hypothetical protein ACTHJY_22240 [Rhizobiaceae bacterium]